MDSMDEFENMLTIVDNQRSAVVYVPLRDGMLRISVDACAYQSGGRNAMSLVVCQDHAKAQQNTINQIIYAARLSERALCHDTQVWISFNTDIPDDDNLWHLGLVIADRLARGVLPAGQGALFVLGSSTDWAYGYVQLPESATARLSSIPQDTQTHVVIAAPPANNHLLSSEVSRLKNERWMEIAYLGALLGHPDPTQSYRKAQVWFPLVGGTSSLAWVSVTVQPQVAGDNTDTNNSIVVNDRTRQQRIQEILTASRSLERDNATGWLTHVQFSTHNFSDSSYELALVMADRMARGREPSPPKRLVATGCSSRWHIGAVDSVGGIDEKILLCQNLLDSGDRFLLPKADGMQAMKALTPLQEKGVTIGLIDKISKI